MQPPDTEALWLAPTLIKEELDDKEQPLNPLLRKRKNGLRKPNAERMATSGYLGSDMKQPEKCFHCIGTGQCRFATLRYKGKGAAQSYWFECVLCGTGEQRLLDDPDLPERPACALCHGTGRDKADNHTQ